jgi:hypothetical protein
MPYATVLFLIAHGAALLWLLLHPERLRDSAPLKFAWFFYVGALIPGALSAYLFFLVAAWALLVVSATFVFLAVDPAEPEKPRKKKERAYEPMMPLSHRDENPPTVPAPPIAS